MVIHSRQTFGIVVANWQLVAFVLLCNQAIAANDDSVRLTTKWAKEVSPHNVLGEYPRPQLVREHWINLNGEWEFELTSGTNDRPSNYTKRILVPFPVESTLSGVTTTVLPKHRMWYRRKFTKPDLAPGNRLQLHFGAVDWSSVVWVNGVEVARHKGGYDPFRVDITDALIEGPEQILELRVIDPSDSGYQPRGKQVLDPGGALYSASSGIWQTVWMEQTPSIFIDRLVITPFIDEEAVEIVTQIATPANADQDALDDFLIRVRIQGEKGIWQRVTGRPGKTIRIRIPNPKLWSPEDPYLYNLTVSLAKRTKPGEARTVTDSVGSYFGMRSIDVRLDTDGHKRIFLNGQPYFCTGPLDQGYWPDGLYTAPTDEALRSDIVLMKQFGFNTARKHVKVEPDRWYYWCDKLGLLVWQDVPNGDAYIRWNEPDLQRTPTSAATFRRELVAMIDALRNHPSIVVWVPFNEGWGQFDTNEIIKWISDYDPSRLVDGPSGYVDRGAGDLRDVHIYTYTSLKDSLANDRPIVIGEFGGLGLAVEGHLWQEWDTWSFDDYESKQALTEAYTGLMGSVLLMKREGLSGAIYTQFSDIEGEVNGLVTYDRKVVKIPPEVVAACNKRLTESPPVVKYLVKTSRDRKARGELWRYSMDPPSSDWMKTDFDDGLWKQGRAGFGTPTAPDATVRTEWNTRDIWLRREIELSANDAKKTLLLVIHHDEDAEVYINGTLAAALTGFTRGYAVFRISAAAVKSIREGKNTLAAHCRQMYGSQYIDIGIIALEPRPKPRAAPAPPQLRPVLD